MTILKNKITGLYFERGHCFNSPRRCASELTAPEVAFIRATFDPTHIEEEDSDDFGCLRCGEKLWTNEDEITDICADCWTEDDGKV